MSPSRRIGELALHDLTFSYNSNSDSICRKYGGIFLPTVYQRGAPGTFKPGNYIVPEKYGAGILQISTRITFAGGEEAVPRPKEARASDTVIVGSAISSRDDGPRDFKMWLVYRDKGCVVCHAEGTTSNFNAVNGMQSDVSRKSSSPGTDPTILFFDFVFRPLDSVLPLINHQPFLPGLNDAADAEIGMRVIELDKW